MRMAQAIAGAIFNVMKIQCGLFYFVVEATYSSRFA